MTTNLHRHCHTVHACHMPNSCDLTTTNQPQNGVDMKLQLYKGIVPVQTVVLKLLQNKSEPKSSAATLLHTSHSLCFMEFELHKGVEASDIVQSSTQTLAALSGTIRLYCLYQSCQLSTARLPQLHVAEGKVQGNKHTKLSAVGVLNMWGERQSTYKEHQNRGLTPPPGDS